MSEPGQATDKANTDATERAIAAARRPHRPRDRRASMTVPYDGEYLRDPRLDTAIAEARAKAREAMERGLRSVDFSISADRARQTIHVGATTGPDIVSLPIDYDTAAELRDMLADGMAHIGAAPHSGNPQMTCAEVEQHYADAMAEADRLREAVKRVRELHRGDMTCDACGFLMPCPTIQPLGEEA